MKRTALSLAAAVAATVAMTTVTLAVEAVVTRDTPVYRRANGNAVVNQVERNQIVDVEECARGRCLVRIPGRDGWVRQDRLARLEDDDRGRGRGRDRDWDGDRGRDRDGGRDRDRDRDQDGQGQPGLTFEFNIGPGGPGFAITDGSENDRERSRRSACIFQHENYGGARECFTPGTTVNNFEWIGWNDVVSSIQVSRGVTVELCVHENHGGECVQYDRDTPSVGRFNDNFSYIRVY